MITTPPPEFTSRLKLLYPEQYSQILIWLNQERSIAVRANTIRIPSEELFTSLLNYDISPQRISWYPAAFSLQNTPTKKITELQLYAEGKIYIQSLSSMIPALVLDPKPMEKVLDMAAAPGSKTSQMAMMMENTGKIIANDISHERLYKLKASLALQGVTNTKVTNYAGQSIWQKFPEYFDKVLVDVPCSMEGRIQFTDPATFSDWSMKKIKRLSKLQKWMLRSAVSATKVGGIIVYSTCTLAPEENEEVIDWILEKEKNTIELQTIHIPQLTMTDGLLHFQVDRFSPEINKTKRIIPDQMMEGFYIAKIKKIASNVPDTF